MQGLFQQCMRRKGIQEEDLFDWEKVPAEVSITTTSNTANVATKETKVTG